MAGELQHHRLGPMTVQLQFASTMQENPEYNPLKWPPEMAVAQLHYDCCKPGIQNPDGHRCVCCQRLQKLENSKWPTRDIIKDFKNFGGGVPGYFYLLLYFIVMFGVLSLVKVLYHIYVLEQVCPTLEHSETPCTSALGGIFKFCDSDILFDTLNSQGKERTADILQYLQLATYLILVVSTICIKVFLQLINKDRISLEEKLFSRFSLIIKNVPLYYQLEDLKEEMKLISPKLEICEAFYIHRMCEFENNFKLLFDMFFQLKSLEEAAKSDDREKKLEQLRKKYGEYVDLYDRVDLLRENINKNTKKIIVVFNTIEEKEMVHRHLKMNECTKFVHYISKIMGCKSDPISYYSERVAEPQEIHWKYIGESSTYKQKVRIETTVLGIGFMLLSFAIFYFPMIKIDEEKVYSPGLGTALGLIISILIIILAIVYRLIILRLMPTRKPSSKLAESFFIVMTTIVFHFFFYLLTPAAFYLFAGSIPDNIKLKEFFMAIVSFALMSILVAIIDLRYRLFNKKRQRLLGQVSEANMFCQQRLHEELTPPSFPIEFKLMVVFNIWTFNSFYIFNLPYLLFFFMMVLAVLYWIDKYNLYKHYKMQQYISIELELKVQKTYIILFLLCVSFGYYLSTQFFWEKYVIMAVVVISLIINFSLNYTYKKQKDNILKHNTDLKSALEQCKGAEAASLHLNLLEMEMKSSFIIPAPPQIEFSSVSLASEILMYGYSETYNLYLKQFKNKDINLMLEQKYLAIKHSKSMFDAGTQPKRRESELAHLAGDGLRERLVEHAEGTQQQLKLQQANNTGDALHRPKSQYQPPRQQLPLPKPLSPASPPQAANQQ